MVEVPPEQPSVTWDELTAKQPEVAEDWDQMERYRQKMGIRIH
jgi:dihydropyrimidine dehydrogenase (NAD+) subunit PreA